MSNFDPLLKDKLLGVPFVGAGTTLEVVALQNLIKSLIEENKYSVEYIINLCTSYGYSRKMASDVFTELTGLSPKLIVENNEYYQNPTYVPSGTIAWGLSKNKKDEAYYVVPFEYGYCVNRKNMTEVPELIAEFTDINSAVEKMKTLVKKVFTLDQIITESLLNDEPIQMSAKTPNDVNEPYFSDPIKILKNRYKKHFITDNEVKSEVFKLVASEQISEQEGIELSEWVKLEEEKRKQDEEENEELKTEDIEFGTIKKDPKGIGQEEQQEFGVLKATWEPTFDYKDDEGTQYWYLVDKETGYPYEDEDGNQFEFETREEALEFAKELNFELNSAIEEEQQCENCRDLNASIKKQAADFEIEDLKEEEQKTDIEKAEESIDEMDIDSLLNEETPESYFETETKNDNIADINERVANIIEEFSNKFKDFEKYDVNLKSYKIQLFNDDKINNNEVIEDLEINAKAIVMIILEINPKEDMNNIKKGLAIFSINNENTYWPGTIKADNDKIYAFSEEGLDTLFRELDTKEEIIEDISGTNI